MTHPNNQKCREKKREINNMLNINQYYITNMKLLRLLLRARLFLFFKEKYLTF